VSNMVQPQIVKNHRIPVVILKLFRKVSGDIIIDLGEVLELVSCMT